MYRSLILCIVVTFLSCNQVQYGEKNEIGYSYYFNSISGDNSNLGTKEKPLKSLDYIEKISLKEGDKILLANGSTFTNTINLTDISGVEVSNYMADKNTKIPIINSKGKIAAVLVENSSNITINNIEITANGGGPNKSFHKIFLRLMYCFLNLVLNILKIVKSLNIKFKPLDYFI